MTDSKCSRLPKNSTDRDQLVIFFSEEMSLSFEKFNDAHQPLSIERGKYMHPASSVSISGLRLTHAASANNNKQYSEHH